MGWSCRHPDRRGCKRSGIKGLTLGAHGGDINAVQYITYQGFKSGYFKHPQMKLVNVLTFGKDTLINESPRNFIPHQ